MMASSVESPTFTSKDRDLIRQEFMDHSGSATSLHNGFRLRRWVAGPSKGQPKVPVVDLPPVWRFFRTLRGMGGFRDLEFL